MKPRYPLQAPALAAALIFVASHSLHAAPIIKADNTIDLNIPDSWVGEILPGPADVARWDSTVTGSNASALTAALAVAGLSVTNPGGAITISGTGALTLGKSGIDMSAATQDLSVTAPITLANGLQQWNVASGRTLATAGAPTKPAQPNTNNAGVLEIGTTGTVVIGAASVPLILDPANNPFATLGKNDWAALESGTVVAATYADAESGLVAGAVNDIKANLTGANGTDVAAIRFNAPEPYDVTVANSATSRTMTARGILVTENSGGGSIGANLNAVGFVRPNRTSTAGAAFPVIQHSAAEFTIGAIIPNASSGAPVRLVKAGTGPLILLANNGYSGGTYIDSGTVRFGNGGTTGFPGDGEIVNHGSLVFNRSDDATLVHNISGTGSFTQMGPGTLSLTTSVSTFTGPVSVTGGTLAATSLDNLGTGTSVTLDGGAIRFLAPFDLSTRTVAFGDNGATIDTGGQTVGFANAVGGGTAGHLIKTGAGSLSLGGAGTWTGGTTVSGGTLLANNTSGSATGSGSITVEENGTLGGTGAVSGAVTAGSGARVAPGSGGIGTLTVGGLSLQSGAILDVELGGGQNDRITVTGSGALAISGGNVRLVQPGGATPFTTPGTYNLIGFSGAISGSVSSLSVANPQPGFTYAFGSSGGFVTVTISTVGIVRSWTNNGSGSWDDAANWNGTVPNATGATANFDTALTAPATITLSAARTVGSITFNSPDYGYTIAATGAGSLTLNNGGSNSNMINAAGTHSISAPLVLASSTVANVASAGDRLTLSGVVNGSGALTKSGPGTLELLGANSFSGNIVLSGGTTIFANGGLGTGTLTLNDATLRWADGNSQDISNRTIDLAEGAVTFDVGSNNVTLASNFGANGVASLTKAGTGTLAIGGTATHFGGTTIADGVLQIGTGGTGGELEGPILNNAALVVNRSGEVRLDYEISGTGTLTKTGGGSLIIAGTNTFTGETTLGAGTLMLENPLALQNSPLLYTGGTLDFGPLLNATIGGLESSINIPLANEFDDPVALTIHTNGNFSLYTGAFSGDGSLTKRGAGTLSLSGENTYVGPTLVTDGGALELDLGGSIDGGALTVSGNTTFRIYDGSLTVQGTSNISNGGSTAPLFEMFEGSATFNGPLNALGNQNNTYGIRINGGTFEAASMSLGRSSLNFGAEPAEGSLVTGLVVNGGDATITGALEMATSAGANSSVSARLESGSLTVGGPVTIGLNNGGRWSVLDVNGGMFRSVHAETGLVLGGPAAGNSVFHVRGGTSIVERIQFGQGEVAGSGVLNINGGALYVGAGGIQVGSTGAFTSTLRLRAGTLGAEAAWETAVPVTLAAAAENPGAITLRAATSTGTPENITLSGGITGIGNLVKNGAGTLTINGGHSFAGNLSVQDGAITLSTATLDDASHVSLSNGGTLNLTFNGTDTVASLTIDGAAAAAGTWGNLTSNAENKTARITGNGVLSIGGSSGGSAYASWASANGLSGADAAASADPDGDGLINLLEFAFDEDPNSGASSGKSRADVATVGAETGFVLTIPVLNGAVFSGATSKTATIDGVTYNIEGTNNLTDFDQTVEEVTPAQSAGLPALNAGWSYRSFRLAGPLGGITSRGPRGFVRVHVTGTP